MALVCCQTRPICRNSSKLMANILRRNRAKIRKMQRYCVWCGSAGTSNNKLQVDHIIPISRNGTHDLENLRILCQNCHKSRQGKAHR